MNIKQITSALIGLLYPRRCPVCGLIVAAPEHLIHTACLARLSMVKQPTCKRCGKEVFSEAAEYCFDCTRHRKSFNGGAALLNYNEPARRSLTAVKYNNRREYLDFYAAAMALKFERRISVWQPQVLIPVPVHASRRRQRGFNQAEELARRLGKQWNIAVDTKLLIRNRKTMPQRSLNPRERLENLRAAFEVAAADGAGAIPQTVLLVDDIYTTGSTVEACTRVLKAAGIKQVYVLTICIGLPC